MQGTVRVKGLKEVNRALKAYSDDARKEMQKDLKEIAEPVAADARALAARYGPQVASGLAAGARVGGAVVRQRRKRTTGDHPEFAGVLMRNVLVPALQRREDEIVDGVERLLDRLERKHGF